MDPDDAKAGLNQAPSRGEKLHLRRSPEWLGYPWQVTGGTVSVPTGSRGAGPCARRYDDLGATCSGSTEARSGGDVTKDVAELRSQEAEHVLSGTDTTSDAEREEEPSLYMIAFETMGNGRLRLSAQQEPCKVK
ncbi:hypothetical protein V5799_004848 [Amblyomma americanum]|uniref:Uncharacterized protein n=1 Tax=Amblyomma americanum TaxID=6943 RepID=A0AAQ4D4X8_AMBAM